MALKGTLPILTTGKGELSQQEQGGVWASDKKSHHVRDQNIIME